MIFPYQRDLRYTFTLGGAIEHPMYTRISKNPKVLPGALWDTLIGMIVDPVPTIWVGIMQSRV
jgi:hypothetical protein